MWIFKYLCSVILFLSIIESALAMDALFQEEDKSSLILNYRQNPGVRANLRYYVTEVDFSDFEKARTARNAIMQDLKAFELDLGDLGQSIFWGDILHPHNRAFHNILADIEADDLKPNPPPPKQNPFDYPDKTTIGVAMSIPIIWMLKEGGLNAVVSCAPFIIDISMAAILYAAYRVLKAAYNYYYPERYRETHEIEKQIIEKELETKSNPIISYGPTESTPEENEGKLTTHTINLQNRPSGITTLKKDLPDLSDIFLNNFNRAINLLSENDSSLTMLCLKSNKIDDNLIREMCIALNKNTFLEELLVDSTKISDVGFMWISLALSENKNLKKLYLLNTQVADYGLAHLACALRKNTTLKFLHINGNHISSEGIDKIRKDSENLDALFIHKKESFKDKIKKTVNESYQTLNNSFARTSSSISNALQDPASACSSLSASFKRIFSRTEIPLLGSNDDLEDDVDRALHLEETTPVLMN